MLMIAALISASNWPLVFIISTSRLRRQVVARIEVGARQTGQQRHHAVRHGRVDVLPLPRHRPVHQSRADGYVGSAKEGPGDSLRDAIDSAEDSDEDLDFPIDLNQE